MPDPEPTLFDAVDPRLAPPSPALRAKDRTNLRKLEAARPMGLTRVGNGWAAPGLFLRKGAEASLTAAGHARVDYAGKHPRLKITRQGRDEIGAGR